MMWIGGSNYNLFQPCLSVAKNYLPVFYLIDKRPTFGSVAGAQGDMTCGVARLWLFDRCLQSFLVIILLVWEPERPFDMTEDRNDKELDEWLVVGTWPANEAELREIPRVEDVTMGGWMPPREPRYASTELASLHLKKSLAHLWAAIQFQSNQYT